MSYDFFIEHEIGNRLLERLTYIKIQPQRILVLGADPDYFSLLLQKLFPQASIFTSFEVDNFDLIFANCYFAPTDNLIQVYAKLHANLNILGLLLFSTYGPDTLSELSISNDWPDMHNLGDLLVKTQFANPVVDAEAIKIEYEKLQELLTDLKDSGKYEIVPLDIPELYQPYTACFEIIYAIAWGKQKLPQQFSNANGQVFVAIEDIKNLN